MRDRSIDLVVLPFAIVLEDDFAVLVDNAAMPSSRTARLCELLKRLHEREPKYRATRLGGHPGRVVGGTWEVADRLMNLVGLRT
jgi:hypothetical protein